MPITETAQHSISAWNILGIGSCLPAWTGILDRKQTGHPVSRQFTFPRFADARSVGGIDRTDPRAAIAAGIGIAGVVKGVLDAVEKPPRRAGLALLITCEGAVAQPRIFVALNAERVAAADGLGRRGADHRHPARRQHAQNDVTHESLLSGAAALIDSL